VKEKKLSISREGWGFPSWQRGGGKRAFFFLPGFARRELSGGEEGTSSVETSQDLPEGGRSNGGEGGLAIESPLRPARAAESGIRRGFFERDLVAGKERGGRETAPLGDDVVGRFQGLEQRSRGEHCRGVARGLRRPRW